MLYKPGSEITDVYEGAMGVTNRYGDVKVSKNLSEKEIKETIAHESVHSFFSPKFKLGQKLRADIGLLGYSESHLIRRVEEGLAESWSKFKSEGFSGIRKGWQFPLENDYGIDKARLRVEKNIAIGTISTAVAGTDTIVDKINGEE